MKKSKMVDGGSPWMWKKGTQYYLGGMLVFRSNWTFNCLALPLVAVHRFKSWIDRTMKRMETCGKRPNYNAENRYISRGYQAEPNQFPWMLEIAEEKYVARGGEYLP